MKWQFQNTFWMSIFEQIWSFNSHFNKLIQGSFKFFLEGKINFEHFPTLSFSSSWGHNLVSFWPNSTSRTSFEHLRPWPFYSYQQKRSFWLDNPPKWLLKKSASLYAPYCNYILHTNVRLHYIPSSHVIINLPPSPITLKQHTNLVEDY